MQRNISDNTIWVNSYDCDKNMSYSQIAMFFNNSEKVERKGREF